MARRFLGSVLLVAGVIFFLQGCQGKDECNSGSCLDENLEINPAGVMAEEDPNFESVEVYDDSLVFHGKGPATEFGYEVGNILISTDSMPGFLRHVWALEPDGKILTVRTFKAGITDLFRGRLQRRVVLSKGLDQPEITDGQGHVLLRPYERFATQRSPLKFEFDAPAGFEVEGDVSFDTENKSLVFSGVKIKKAVTCDGSGCSGGKCNDVSQCPSGFDCEGDDNPADGKIEGICKKDGSGLTPYISLNLDGSVKPTVDADFDLNLGFEWFHPVIENFKVSFTGGMNINFSNIALEAGFEAVLKKEFKIGQVTISTPIPIGPFTIPAALRFAFYIGTDNKLELSGNVSTHFELDGSLTVGAEYKEKTWTPIKTSHFDANMAPFQGSYNGKVSLKVYVKPEILFEFIQGTGVGPSLALEPSLNLIYQFLPERCLDVFFALALKFKIQADALVSWCPPDWLDSGASRTIAEKVCGGLTSVVSVLADFEKDWELYRKTFYSDCKIKVCKKDKIGGDNSEDVYWWDVTKGALVPDEEFGLFTHCDLEDPAGVCCGGECVEFCGQGNLEGLVVDRADENIKIQGAHVVVINSDGATVYDGTTGADGVYRVNDLDAGHYTLKVNADGYFPYSADVHIRSNETEYMAKLVAIPEGCEIDGTISGTITDATDNLPIAGAEINVRTMAEDTLVTTTTTDENGNYKTDPVPVNYYKVVVTAPSYSSAEKENVAVCGYDDEDPDNDDVVVNMTLAPYEGYYHVVLRWGDSPKDLDLHAKLPSGEHLFYRGGCRGERHSPPYAELDYDVRGGYGPETITITEPQQGTYQFFVHNYGGQNDDADSGSLSASGAQLEVSDADGNSLRTFDVPGGCGAYFWYAFNLVFDANGNATIQATNNCGGGSNPADYEDPPTCDLP